VLLLSDVAQGAITARWFANLGWVQGKGRQSLVYVHDAVVLDIAVAQPSGVPWLNQFCAHHAMRAHFPRVLPFKGPVAGTPKGRVATDHDNLRQATIMLSENCPQASADNQGIILKNAAAHVGHHQHFRAQVESS